LQHSQSTSFLGIVAKIPFVVMHKNSQKKGATPAVSPFRMLADWRSTSRQHV